MPSWLKTGSSSRLSLIVATIGAAGAVIAAAVSRYGVIALVWSVAVGAGVAVMLGLWAMARHLPTPGSDSFRWKALLLAALIGATVYLMPYAVGQRTLSIAELANHVKSEQGVPLPSYVDKELCDVVQIAGLYPPTVGTDKFTLSVWPSEESKPYRSREILIRAPSVQGLGSDPAGKCFLITGRIVDSHTAPASLEIILAALEAQNPNTSRRNHTMNLAGIAALASTLGFFLLFPTVTGASRLVQADSVTMEDIWEQHKKQHHEKVIELADKMIAVASTPHDRRVTCMYLKAENLRMLGRFDEAKALFVETRASAAASEGWDDPKEGRIEVGPLCDLSLLLTQEKLTGPFPSTSEDLTRYAWKSLNSGKLELAITFAEYCTKRFGKQAKEQQAEHERLYGRGVKKFKPKSPEEDSMWKSYWALYDVGTAHYIIGLACGKEAARVEQAKRVELAKRGIAEMETVIRDYPSAQAFDPSGPWYWSVKEAVEKQLPDLRAMSR